MPSSEWPAAEGRLVDTGEIRLRVVEQGDGPAVVLCHGFPGLAHSWRNQTAADMTGLLDALGVRDAVFVGHDFGAGPTRDLPQWAPGRVRARPRGSPTRTGRRPGRLPGPRVLGAVWRASHAVWRGKQDRPDEPVTVPVLFVGGDRDPVLRRPFAGRDPFRVTRATVPGLAGIHVVPGIGHFVQLEAAGQVNKLMVDFLSFVVR